jgi:hypothetical protein
MEAVGVFGALVYIHHSARCKVTKDGNIKKEN